MLPESLDDFEYPGGRAWATEAVTIVTLASLGIVKGIALLVSNGTPILGMPGPVQTIGSGSIDWFPYSFFVVVGLAVAVGLACGALVWAAGCTRSAAIRRRRGARASPSSASSSPCTC
jgi:ribose/xylose/arabinose/galactoside ABC-type transport system permease subunit